MLMVPMSARFHSLVLILRILTTYMTQLPSEIWENVLDHLSSDIAALVCCALVSRLFSWKSRYLLLSRIRLTSRKSLYSLARVAKDRKLGSPWHDPQELHLEERPSSQDCQGSFVYLVPIILARYLTKVEVLSFSSVNWRTETLISNSPFELAMSSLASVETLSISKCMFPNLHALYRLIRCMPRLTSLNVSDCDVHFARRTPEHATPILRLGLTRLVIQDCPAIVSEDLISCLQGSPTRHTLRTFVLKTDSPCNDASMLTTWGDQLEHFEVDHGQSDKGFDATQTRDECSGDMSSRIAERHIHSIDTKHAAACPDAARANSSVDSLRPVKSMASCQLLHSRGSFQAKEDLFALPPPSWLQGGDLDSGDLRLQRSSSFMIHDCTLIFRSSITVSDVSPKPFHVHCALPLHQNKIIPFLMPLRRAVTVLEVKKYTFRSFAELKDLIGHLSEHSMFHLCNSSIERAQDIRNWAHQFQDPQLTVLKLDGCCSSLSFLLLTWLLATPSRQSLRTLPLQGDIQFSVLEKVLVVLSCRLAHSRVQYTREQGDDGCILSPEVPGESLVIANVHVALRDPHDRNSLEAERSPQPHCCDLETRPLRERPACLCTPSSPVTRVIPNLRDSSHGQPVEAVQHISRYDHHIEKLCERLRAACPLNVWPDVIRHQLTEAERSKTPDCFITNQHRRAVPARSSPLANPTICGSCDPSHGKSVEAERFQLPDSSQMRAQSHSQPICPAPSSLSMNFGKHTSRGSPYGLPVNTQQSQSQKRSFTATRPHDQRSGLIVLFRSAMKVSIRELSYFPRSQPVEAEQSPLPDGFRLGAHSHQRRSGGRTPLPPERLSTSQACDALRSWPVEAGRLKLPKQLCGKVHGQLHQQGSALHSLLSSPLKLASHCNGAGKRHDQNKRPMYTPFPSYTWTWTTGSLLECRQSELHHNSEGLRMMSCGYKGSVMLPLKPGFLAILCTCLMLFCLICIRLNRDSRTSSPESEGPILDRSTMCLIVTQSLHSRLIAVTGESDGSYMPLEARAPKPAPQTPPTFQSYFTLTLPEDFGLPPI